MLLQTFHEFTSHAMSPVAAVALHAAIGAFIIAAIIALAALLQPTRARMSWADWTGAFATGALVAYFAVRFARTGTEPLQNMFDVVGLSALFLALVYFAATRLKKLESVGAFAYPAIVVIFLVNLLLAGTATQGADAPITSPLLIAHIVLIILAYGVFFMATVAAVMFLLQERMLKKHKDPAFMRSFPSLESLRRLVNACVLIGLPLVTVGFALGFVSFRTEDWAQIYTNPKVLSSLVLWLVLIAVVIGRRFGWLHGRRHFYLVLVGFALVLVTYVGLGLVEARGKTDVAGVERNPG
jgi:ABC-type uncharacterized transport system permease subunit